MSELAFGAVPGELVKSTCRLKRLPRSDRVQFCTATVSCQIFHRSTGAVRLGGAVRLSSTGGLDPGSRSCRPSSQKCVCLRTSYGSVRSIFGGSLYLAGGCYYQP
jgi:hypothetical protein